MFLWGIPCASTRNAQRKISACIIRPDCCCQKVVIMAQPSTLLPGRTVSASISARKGSCRKHGDLRNFIITFRKETRQRPAGVWGVTSAVAVGRITVTIMARTCSRQSSRKKSWRSSPSSVARKESVSTTTSRTGTSGFKIQLFSFSRRIRRDRRNFSNKNRKNPFCVVEAVAFCANDITFSLWSSSQTKAYIIVTVPLGHQPPKKKNPALSG